jgi:flagellar biosynthesis protein FliP
MSPLFYLAVKTQPGLNLGGNNQIPWTVVFTLTLLTLVPAILLSMTPMVRLLVVFHFLRQALGTQTAPSNQVLMGLGLMMTWFLMQPVLVQVDQQAVEPFRQGQISGW